MKEPLVEKMFSSRNLIYIVECTFKNKRGGEQALKRSPRVLNFYANLLLPYHLLIIIPITRLLGNLGPTRRLAHNNTVDAQDRYRSFSSQFERPLLRS